MKQLIFKGYDERVFYGDGGFTIGKSYSMVNGSLKYHDTYAEQATFIDDTGRKMHEDTRYFDKPEETK